jgi:hypothetical protein
LILIDFSAVAISGIMKTPEMEGAKKGSSPVLNPSSARIVTFNTIQNTRRMFKEKCGEVVICCDSPKLWRKEVFPYYKANRGKIKAESPYDWPVISQTIVEMKRELREYFPYPVIEVEGAEADDIIGVLASRQRFDDSEPVMILSKDKDFAQVQRYPNVRQWSTLRKDFIVSKDPEGDLLDQIFSGDRIDGIPNVLSDADTFMIPGKRQRTLTEGRKNLLRQWRTSGDDSFLDNTKVFGKEISPEAIQDGFSRNEALIDFRCIPDEIEEGILDAIDVYENVRGSRGRIMEYMMKWRMSELLPYLNNF